MEWFRFALSALFMILGIIGFIVGIFGVYKLKFVMNRMHSAAICDTAGLFFIIISLVIGRGFDPVSIKLILIVLFFWLTCPITSHLIAKMEYFTDPDLGKEIKNDINELKGGDNNGTDDL